MLRRLSLLFPFLLLWSQSVAAVGTPSHVKASLVAADAAVQPGQPVTVALRLVHDPHWHTYWLNPGTGLATKLEWKLPPGWKAGEIQWPAPDVLRDKTKTVIGNGYEGDLLLPVTLTPPADLKAGDKVELKAAASWLMCENVCIPGDAEVALTLPVASGAPAPDANWGGKIRAVIAGLPRVDDAWKAAASRSAKTVT
jgi:DsbC/DsbD-like thiol-disulfide interchange protein